MDTEIEVNELMDIVEYDYPNFHLYMQNVRCSVISGKINLNEHIAFNWLSINDLDNVDWFPGDKNFIEKLK